MLIGHLSTHYGITYLAMLVQDKDYENETNRSK